MIQKEESLLSLLWFILLEFQFLFQVKLLPEENLVYIKKNMDAGLPVQGPEDFDFRMLRVIKEHQAIK